MNQKNYHPTKAIFMACCMLLSIGFSAISSAGERVNGYTAETVLYNNGSERNAFVHKGNGKWEENTRGGVHKYNEVRRDPWTVYLERYPNIQVYLDLWTNKIYYQSKTQPRTPLYTITLSKAANGHTASHITYNDGTGSFTQKSDGSWVEQNAGGKFYFTEVSRDEWSVILHKTGTNMLVSLDLWTEWVKYKEGSGDFGNLYPISSMSSK